MKYGTCDGGGGAAGKYIMELDVDMNICPSIWNIRIYWALCSSFLRSFSASNFILFSSNLIHFSSASLLLWAKAFVMVSIAASTFVLLPFFFCCCSEGPCYSGPAVAIASIGSCSVGVVLLLGVDPCCWPVSVLLSKLLVASAASSSSEAESCLVLLLGVRGASCWRVSSSARGLFSGLSPKTESINSKYGHVSWLCQPF